jgi:hypothetical protein
MASRLISLRKAAGRVARRLPITGRLVQARRLRTRKRLLASMPRQSVCAEIGVWRGSFSELILDIVHPRMLHLIDPWAFLAESPDAWEGGRLAQDQVSMDAVYTDVLRRFEGRDNVVIHRATSSDAAGLFEADYFDWVYIDGNHHYEYVKADLEGYLPLVKGSGLMAGDDYYWGTNLGFPVKRAVDEFVRQGNVELVSIVDSQFILRKQ